MPTLARADLESLLRTRQLDRTLTTALPRDRDVASTGLAPLDARLAGGFPRGQLSELTGAASSGRTSLLLHTLAAATRRAEVVALIDALDTFDVASGAAAGIVADRFLWVRGTVPAQGASREATARALEQTLKAAALVLQAGNFGIVAIDLAGAPRDAIRRLPFTTWLRLQRMIEGSSTVGLLVADEPLARSAAGLTVTLDARPRFDARLFRGFDVAPRIVDARGARWCRPGSASGAADGAGAMVSRSPESNSVRLSLSAVAF